MSFSRHSRRRRHRYASSILLYPCATSSYSSYPSHHLLIGLQLLQEVAVELELRFAHLLVQTPCSGLLNLLLQLLAIPELTTEAALQGS